MNTMEIVGIIIILLPIIAFFYGIVKGIRIVRQEYQRDLYLSAWITGPISVEAFLGMQPSSPQDYAGVYIIHNMTKDKYYVG